MKYTREQAEEVLIDFYGYKDLPIGSNIKEFLNAKFPQLPEKGLVVSVNGSIVMRTGDNAGYGFDNIGEFEESNLWTFYDSPNLWRPATKEDEERWKELLIEKIKKDYPIGTTFKCLSSNLKCTVTKDSMKSWNNGGDSLNSLWANTLDIENPKHSWHNNGLIFNDGKWAEIIEQPEKDITDEEAKESLEKFAKWFAQNVKNKNGII